MIQQILAIIFLSVVAIPLGIAQTLNKIPRIGYLASGTPETVAVRLNRDAFLDGLKELGWIDGKNLVIDYRYAKGDRSLLPELVAELIRLKVAVIIPTGPTAFLPAVKTTANLPIVMITAGPRWRDYIKSNSYPGGNVTGLSGTAEALETKMIERIKEGFPKFSNVVMLDPPRLNRNIETYQRAAQIFGIGLKTVAVRNDDDFAVAFAEIKNLNPDALITIRNTITQRHARAIAQFAIDNRIPLFADDLQFVESGALWSFGVNYRANWRRAAVFVDKILKGTNPGDIPIEPPALEFSINLDTAKKLGVTIPPEILLEADKVIK